MQKNKCLDFDNEMRTLSMGVYKGNEKYIPKDWIRIAEQDSKNGFHGEAFYKNGTIVVSFRGTDEFINDLLKEDILKLGLNKLPAQYIYAQEFYKKVKKDFPNKKIIFTGHSLGGSLAQLLGNETGNKTVTFNAYGVGNLIPKEDIKNNADIKNYGNVDDTVFNLNLRNQLGKTYIIDYGKDCEYITKSPNGNYFGGLYPLKKHSIENMGNIEDAVEYKKPKDQEATLTGKVSFNVSAQDLDKKRIITQEEIKQMNNEEFLRNEKFIHQQIKIGNVMSKSEAEQGVKSGNLIWVHSYTHDDGTEVHGYYRRK